MFSVKLSDKYKINMNGGSSKGTQDKYRKDEYWYKEDKLGCEGFVEYLVSQVLEHSSLHEAEYVKYEYGLINGKSGCRSVDFSKGEFQFFSLERLHRSITGIGLAEKTRLMDSPEMRKKYVLEFFMTYYGIDLTFYLRRVISLDMLTLNEDRHFNNLGVLLNSSGYYFNAPIFDNGMCLLNGNVSIGRGLSLEENTKRVTSKPFSGSPESQYRLFNNNSQLKSRCCAFVIDYIGLVNSLLHENVEKSLEFYINVLLYQLKKYIKVYCKEYEKTALMYKGKQKGTRLCFSVSDKRVVYDVDYVLECNRSIELIECEDLYKSKEEIKGLLEPIYINKKDFEKILEVLGKESEEYL